MGIRQVSYLKIGEGKRGNKRLWLEGKKMALSCFEKGQAYITVLDVQSQSLSLILDENGDKKVSGRKKNGQVLPIIDLCNASITQHIEEAMGGTKRVRVVFKSRRIQVSVHHEETKRLTREDQTRKHLAQGILAEATLCAGGTVSNRALHEGFEAAGIDSVTEFIVEMDGRYIQSAMDNNPYITDDTVIFETTLEEMEPELIGDVLAEKGLSGLDVLNVSLPCTGFSSAGRSKNKIPAGEFHSSAGSAVVGLLKIFHATNPSIITSENVPQFQDSATKAILKNYLEKTGYVVQEKILGREMGAFENRDRHIMIAMSEGLAQDFDMQMIRPSSVPPKTLAEVLDEVPNDDSMWKSYAHLKAKEKRDLAQGKGFRRCIVDPEAESVPSIRRGYNKAGSTDVMISHPTDPEKSRLLTVAEHARVKGIPESIVANQPKSVAHQILGQSVLYPVFKSIGILLGTYLREASHGDVSALDGLLTDFKMLRDQGEDTEELFFNEMIQIAREISYLHSQVREEEYDFRP